MAISPAPDGWVPDACTLPTVERPIRVAEFDRLFAEGVRAVRRPAPTRLELDLSADTEAAGRDLAARESQCCSFFAFDFHADASAVVMGVEVPPAYTDVLDAVAERVRAAIGGRP
ncbi:hypothetical protein [Nocardia asteroides]|uniref:hypothetical protein n=1 Tax=Nocardia asteroides TaxID=1824 RepID=UPI00341689FB